MFRLESSYHNNNYYIILYFLYYIFILHFTFLEFAVLVLDHDICLYMYTQRIRWIYSDYLEYIFCVYEPPEDGRQTGPKHVVW
jgi:hypothetical protein